MFEKKVSFLDVIVSILLSLLSLAIFCVLALMLFNSLKAIPSPSEHTLKWLPEEYPRIEERFTIEGRQKIVYAFHLGEATGRLSLPFKSAIDPLTVHKIKSWYLFQNSLIVEYGVDYSALGIIFVLAVVFGGGTVFFAWRCLSQIKKLRLRKRKSHPSENPA